jgi:hypothetical protein
MSAGSGLDEWIYWHLLLQFLNRNQLHELTINLRPNSSFLTAKDSLHSRSRSFSPTDFWVWVLRYDRQSVGQSIFEQRTHLGLTAIFLLLSESCGFVDVGRSLWREDGHVVYNYCWYSPAQSFSGEKSRGTRDHISLSQVTDFLFVTSYDLVGVRRSYSTQIQSYVTTYVQSSSLSWKTALIWALSPDSYRRVDVERSL